MHDARTIKSGVKREMVRATSGFIVRLIDREGAFHARTES